MAAFKSAWIMPLAGGGVAAAMAIGSRFLVGAVYSQADAVQLIESLARSGLYLGSAIATSSATILALMLTLLGLTRKMDTDFDKEVFVRIDRIGLLSTIGLCGALGMLLILTLPVGEFDQLPKRWFPILYNVLVGITGILTGLLISTVLLLFTTLRRVISRVTPTDDV